MLFNYIYFKLQKLNPQLTAANTFTKYNIVVNTPKWIDMDK